MTVSRIQGDDVVRDAHMRLKREYRDKVQTVEVAVSMAGVRSVAGKKNILQDNLIKEVKPAVPFRCRNAFPL